MCLSDKESTSISPGSPICFHPCFNGCVFQTLISARDPEVSMSVSILVLMDVSFRLLSLINTCLLFQVSILVLMDVSFRHIINRICRCCIQVSILVLMDVSFRLDEDEKIMKKEEFPSLF
ncbi:MAG: hypothetical protein PWP15_1004 [Methanothermococcus sp.]|nr:hypothetical protein [Methanothermococcus sp.]